MCPEASCLLRSDAVHCESRSVSFRHPFPVFFEACFRPGRWHFSVGRTRAERAVATDLRASNPILHAVSPLRPPPLPSFPRHRRPSFSHRRTSNPGSIPSSSRHIVLPPAPPASAPTHLSTSPLGRSFLRLDRSRAEAQAARTREATSNVTRVASSPLSLCPSPEGKGRTWTKGRYRYLDRKISMGGRGMGIRGEGRGRETGVSPLRGKGRNGEASRGAPWTMVRRGSKVNPGHRERCVQILSGHERCSHVEGSQDRSGPDFSEKAGNRPKRSDPVLHGKSSLRDIDQHHPGPIALPEASCVEERLWCNPPPRPTPVLVDPRKQQATTHTTFVSGTQLVSDRAGDGPNRLETFEENPWPAATVAARTVA